MRVSNHAARLAAGAVVALMLMSACGSPPPPSASPTVRPTPIITPDPHLTEPATADQVFAAIRAGDLDLLVNNASSGGASAVVKRINGAIDNWPLIITQYQTSALLRTAGDWEPAKPPGPGNPPYAFAGLNILVEFGPTIGIVEPPSAIRQEQAKALVALLDPVLWPLEQRSVTPIVTRSAPPASPAASASAAP